MAPKEKITPQAAAVPIREDGKICLVTSSSGRRWGIPKGMIDAGMTAEETALQEAWEEAGVRGKVDSEPIGSFQYAKWGLQLEVTVFLLRVSEVHEDWPEKSMRQRDWLSPTKAAKIIDRQPLARIIVQYFKTE